MGSIQASRSARGRAARPARLPRICVALPALVGALAAAGPAQAHEDAPVAFRAPATVSDPASSATGPAVGVAADGDAVVAWRASAPGAGAVVQAAARRAGRAWSAPQTLSASGQVASPPRIAVSPRGDAVAVWEQGSIFTGLFIQAATRRADGRWSAPATLGPTTGFATTPDAAISATGDAVAVWSQGGTVDAASHPARGGWTAPVALDAPAGSSPRVAVTPGGDAVAVWAGPGTGGSSGVRSAASDDLRTWSPAVTVASGGALGALAPDVDVSALGTAVAVWERFDTGSLTVEAAVRARRGGWSAPTTLSTAGRSATDPHVAVDVLGDATAVWQESTGGDILVRSASRGLRGGWTDPATLGAPSTFSTHPRVDVSLTGEAVAVWALRTTGNGVVQAAARRPARGWSAARTISDPAVSAADPEVAVSALGDAVSAWQAFPGTALAVQAAATR